MPRPYYEQAGIVIYHGDCREILPTLEPASVDLVLTDPPYGYGTYKTDLDPGPQMLQWLLTTAPISAVFGYPETLVRWCVCAGAIPDEWVTWWPTNAMRWHDPHLQRQSECIAIFGTLPGHQRLRTERSEASKRIAAALGKNPDGDSPMGDVWRDAKPGMGFLHHLRLHPNEKPESLMARLILLCSDAGQLILDSFAGSGTTLLAAKKLGRRAIGIEIEERYCEIAARRLAQQVLPLEVALA